jgi:hypothetical protein
VSRALRAAPRVAIRAWTSLACSSSRRYPVCSATSRASRTLCSASRAAPRSRLQAPRPIRASASWYLVPGTGGPGQINGLRVQVLRLVMFAQLLVGAGERVQGIRLGAPVADLPGQGKRGLALRERLLVTAASRCTAAQVALVSASLDRSPISW